MDTFIARQPIFDRKQTVYGYELLYRQSFQNFFTGTDDNQATAELIYNSFFVMGLGDLTDGTVAFLNFPKSLLDSQIPYMLPPKGVVIEVLERSAATPDVVAACEKLRSAGYTLALDDFALDEENLPLVGVADIIKVEFPAVSPEDQRALIQKHRGKTRFLAEKIETREDFQLAVRLGYDLFQGYFFSKPAVISKKEISSLDANLFQIVGELRQPEPSFRTISEIIECDLGLSYKLLKLVNSAYYESRHEIKSISHALSYIGIKDLYQWFSLMMIKSIQTVENAEMIKLSLIRGKLMELLAVRLGKKAKKTHYFFTGMFSFIDVLLNSPMERLLDTLPLPEGVGQALLGEQNDFRRLLDCVMACETGNWDDIEDCYPLDVLGAEQFTALYLEALKWAKHLKY